MRGVSDHWKVIFHLKGFSKNPCQSLRRSWSEEKGFIVIPSIKGPIQIVTLFFSGGARRDSLTKNVNLLSKRRAVRGLSIINRLSGKGGNKVTVRPAS